MARKKKKEKKEKDKTAPQPEIDMSQAGRFAVSMAIILNNCLKHYWLSQADAKAAVSECFGLLSGILETCEQIAIRIINRVFMINGNVVEAKSRTMQMFVDHLLGLEIDNFTLTQGISREDFVKLLEIFEARPTEIKQFGGFRALLEKFEIKNVQTKKMIYREVAEEETVVSKNDLEKSERARGHVEEVTGSIVAFLKGDVSVKDENVAKRVQETASDPARMAELILQAAEIRQKSADVEKGENLVDFVVGCLRRTYEGMTQDSSFKTQKGKKKITRDLILLEEEVLNRMREMSADWDEEDLSAISAATEEMTDEVKIDALADEYMTKFSATQASEQKILNFIKSEGVESGGESKLQKKLADRGLSISGWRELVVKSEAAQGAGGGPGPGGGFGPGHIVEAIAHLDTLLDNMEKEFAKSDKPAQEDNAQKLLDVLRDVSREIKALTMGTDRKIQNLIENLRADDEIVGIAEKEAQAAGKDFLLTRKQMLDIIAEIVREITEPLELIKSSLDMVNSKVLGGNAELQSSVVRLATDNALIIKMLLDNMKRISATSADS